MSELETSLEDLLQSAYRYAHALCAHAEMAEDLVHEGWLKALAKHGPQPDKALLFRVIRNLFIDEIRHKKKFPNFSYEEQSEFDDAICGSSEQGSHSFDPSHYASHDLVLAQGLAELRSVDREILFLSVFDGHTAAEIAALTGQSRGTVLSQLHRAKGKLKKHLDHHANQKFKVIENSGKNAS